MDLQALKNRFSIIGNTPALNHALNTAEQVAATDLTVLIVGESGVGKEVFSQIIHSLSARKHNPFIAVNCGAIPEGNTSPPEKFGASDVFDLNWVQLMNAYSCTECGRCTSACPANLTGKKLSPRKIMMDTRDRLEEVGKNLNENKGVFKADEKQLLNDFITPEELWACTSCNACVEACPIEIDPLSIIMDMRQYLVMEKSAAPTELNSMMGNIENNGAPWPFSNQDRLQWVNE